MATIAQAWNRLYNWLTGTSADAPNLALSKKTPSTQIAITSVAAGNVGVGSSVASASIDVENYTRMGISAKCDSGAKQFHVLVAFLPLDASASEFGTTTVIDTRRTAQPGGHTVLELPPCRAVKIYIFNDDTVALAFFDTTIVLHA